MKTTPLRRAGLWALAAGALAGVFLAYRQPDLMVDLANRVWSCF
ncbi:hypothetical protein [Methylibium sp.]|nr:hypothetical protein [Methylibium sp.]